MIITLGSWKKIPTWEIFWLALSAICVFGPSVGLWLITKETTRSDFNLSGAISAYFLILASYGLMFGNETLRPHNSIVSQRKRGWLEAASRSWSYILLISLLWAVASAFVMDVAINITVAVLSGALLVFGVLVYKESSITTIAKGHYVVVADTAYFEGATLIDSPHAHHTFKKTTIDLSYLGVTVDSRDGRFTLNINTKVEILGYLHKKEKYNHETFMEALQGSIRNRVEAVGRTATLGELFNMQWSPEEFQIQNITVRWLGGVDFSLKSN